MTNPIPTAPAPWKMSDSITGRAKRREHPDYCLRSCTSATQDPYWAVVFLLTDSRDARHRLTFHFPKIPTDRARKIRDFLRAVVADGKVHNLADWQKATSVARDAMTERGWILPCRGGYKPA